MSENSFYKLSGAGNDFILFDLRENRNFVLDEELVRKLCDRRNGIGSDGIILIDDKLGVNFTMTYYNADGSRGSLCGNGARCAIKYADHSGRLNDSDVKFICEDVNYSGKKLDEEKIKFFLQNPTDKVSGIMLETGKYFMNAWFINTGSPHVVINVDDINSRDETEAGQKSIGDLPVTQLGREIRHHEKFSPDGTNVNFIKLDGDRVIIRTYERGVENETLACGTGSVASAIFVNENYNIAPPLKLITKGGEELSVDFSLNGHSVENVSLTGPAKIVYEGKISISNL